jgi:hypothetical protein
LLSQQEEERAKWADRLGKSSSVQQQQGSQGAAAAAATRGASSQQQQQSYSSPAPAATATAAAAAAVEKRKQQRSLSQQQQELFSQQRQQQFSQQQQEQRQLQNLPVGKRSADSRAADSAHQPSDSKRSRHGGLVEHAAAEKEQSLKPRTSSGQLNRSISSLEGASAAAAAAAGERQEPSRLDMPAVDAAASQGGRGLDRRLISVSSSASQQQQQQQQERTKAEQSSKQQADLAARLAAVDRQHKHTSTCQHWSGENGSCRFDRRCKFVDSHVLGHPTAHYNARAAVLESAGYVKDFLGKYRRQPGGHHASAHDRMQQRQQQQQQQQSFSEHHKLPSPMQAVNRDPNSPQGPPEQQKHLQQGEQQQQQQQHDRMMKALFDEIYDVDRRWGPRSDSGCRFWSGLEGSCRHAQRCRNAHSHYRDQPTCEEPSSVCNGRCLVWNLLCRL